MPERPLHEVEKRRARVARYVARGYSYAEIAPLVEVSPSQVYHDYKAWAKQRRERLRADHDQAFMEILNALDESVRRAWEEIGNNAAEPKDRKGLLDTIGKLLERKARLLGLVSDSEGGTTNILAVVHPSAADELKHALTAERATAIESEVLEGEYRDVTPKQLPAPKDADGI